MLSNRSFGWTASLLGLSAFAGASALVWGSTRHVYRVPFKEASTAFLQWCTDEADVDPIAGQHYLSMFGDRYMWMDLGLGLTAAAVAGLSLAAILYVSRPGEQWARTPSRRLHFLLAGWVVIALSYFAVVYSLEKDLERRQFPWCADSIAIPIFGAGLTSVVLMVVCTLLGFMLVRNFGALPAPLMQWDVGRPRRSWAVTVVSVMLILLIATAMTLDAANSMSIGNAAGMVAIYLLASTRAALLSPKQVDE